MVPRFSKRREMWSSNVFYTHIFWFYLEDSSSADPHLLYLYSNTFEIVLGNSAITLHEDFVTRAHDIVQISHRVSSELGFVRNYSLETLTLFQNGQDEVLIRILKRIFLSCACVAKLVMSHAKETVVNRRNDSNNCW
jgi:hypothetical protein